ncbi:hypothetical protein [Parasediminibacterium sp. JCM 36343]|uniref:hypothetical protein n=1 Tax=Parasediminibacterium sp. JCM 36343 TaxID=3374279 RepID=UPI00397E8D7A
MQTVLVEIEDNKAFALLENLERLNILKIVAEKAPRPATRLSEKYKGVFTKEDAESFDKHTQNMRNEWESI